MEREIVLQPDFQIGQLQVESAPMERVIEFLSARENTINEFHIKNNKRRFDSAENIAVLMGPRRGIGDAVMELKPTIAAAQARPDKNFYVAAPSFFLTSSRLDMPDNVHLDDGLPDLFKYDDTAFYMSYDPYKLAQFKLPHYLGQGSMAKKHIKKAVDTDRTCEVQVEHKLLADQIDTHLAKENPNHYYSLSQIQHTAFLHSLGIDLTQDSFSRSIYNQMDSVSGYNYDLLIAPDAQETSRSFISQGSTETKDGDKHLIKSFTREKWKEIFSLLPHDLEVGILMGVSHPEYCQAVFSHALQSGLTVTPVTTETMDDFYNVVRSSNKYIGMDSGTTHIAADIVRSIPDTTDSPQVREIFNGTYVSQKYYGIAGIGNRGKILTNSRKEPTASSDLLSLDVIPSSRIARFIQS